MDTQKIYAVLTGDVVSSSKVKKSQKEQLSDTLKKSFSKIERFTESPVYPAFEIFRGDSFQGVLGDPSQALKSAIHIRAMLRMNQPDKVTSNWDARIAVGIGTIDYLENNATEGDGTAYRNSGPALDEQRGDERMTIRTPWDSVNNEMQTECALMDAIVAKWSPPQAEIIIKLLDGMVQEAIAKELGISQAAVHYRTKSAGWFAVEKFLNRYHTLVKEKLEAS